jgi:hypothetical protein
MPLSASQKKITNLKEFFEDAWNVIQKVSKGKKYIYLRKYPLFSSDHITLACLM